MNFWPKRKTMRKILSVLFVFGMLSFTLSAQVHTATATPDTTCAGELVQLELITGGAQDSATFNNGSLPIGWTSTNQVMFNNPCNPTANGTIYCWMGKLKIFWFVLTREGKSCASLRKLNLAYFSVVVTDE